MGSVSVFDSAIFKSSFGTEEIRGIFNDNAFIHRCVDVEAALARAQSRCGVIPSEMGEIISQKSDASKLDLERLRKETDIVGYPILPMVRQLAAMCGEDKAGRYVHWGATTQDIMDTATMMQVKQGLQVVQRELQTLASHLRTLSGKYRDTPMAGRTHLQHALPVAFGFKCAVWLSSVQRHLERLVQLKDRVLLVQFGGAAGTLASLGSEKGVQVRCELAKELELQNPLITWHVARDTVAEAINFLALVGGTLGKIGFDLIVMSSNELSEVAEPFVPHRGASSTMPQKRNPISSELMLAASKVLRSHASLALDGMVADFERASGPWHLEWVAIPESFTMAVGALHQANFALSGLVVHEEQMLENLNSTRGLIVGEAVMMGLAPYIGRQRAHDVVYEACKESIETKTSLYECLKDKDELNGTVSEDMLRDLCNPIKYLGASTTMIDDVLNATI